MSHRHRSNRITVFLVAAAVAGVLSASGRGRPPPVRGVTPAAKAELAAVPLVNGPRPPGGYLYPDRVWDQWHGDRWQRTKESSYSHGIPFAFVCIVGK
ncbi:MAG: hypothetical protein JXR37_27015 [Kiritimatiellae bacterium]|nr:hypothetical protein [Kiritimatiellia bacterium]